MHLYIGVIMEHKHEASKINPLKFLDIEIDVSSNLSSILDGCLPPGKDLGRLEHGTIIATIDKSDKETALIIMGNVVCYLN